MTIESLKSDLKKAMIAHNAKELAVLRLISAAIKQIEVDERITVDDGRFLAILDKMVKQRNESIEQFVKGQRPDLVEQEEFEINIIKRYLPEPLSEEEITTLIKQAIANTDATTLRDMGKVMEILKPQLQGRADMGKVSAAVKTQLS